MHSSQPGLSFPNRLLAGVLCGFLAAGAMANDTAPAGRYLDRNVRVHDAAQLNPLLQIGDLHFSDRLTIGEAVRTALAGTGYRLAVPRHAGVRSLLNSRLAIPHIRFRDKRIDSVVGAIVGIGRGYDVQVDHSARRIRIVPSTPIPPAPVKRNLRPVRATILFQGGRR